ncbi:hypothetical protein [Microseira sp. BLCC-F43]|jgi:hypothetical protein|uniref:hypothetical protein n=1 Tax=Microseira sp. BLCC-F43 TaxID=3153602 RepID=UPI0035B76F76
MKTNDLILDNFEYFLSMPVQTTPYQCQKEFEYEVELMVIRQKALSELIQGSISLAEFEEVISECGIDPIEAEENWTQGLSLF